MKINSLKLTIQDVTTADNHRVAGISATLFIDDGEFKMNELEDGTKEPVLDEDGEKIPMYETINATGALGANPEMKKVIQALIIELLTLKNLEVAKENGEIEHFVQAVQGVGEEATKKVSGKNKKPKIVRKKK